MAKDKIKKAKKEKKEKKDRKGFFKEFKEFISRGNVFDMAVGIIVGGAFTAIVTALCDNVLKPIINWILALIVGTDSLEGIYSFLKTSYVIDEVTKQPTTTIDLANSIYIDWGSLINAVINFLLIALVLFLIIKIINKVHQMSKAARESVEEAAKKRREEKEAAAFAEAGEAAPASADETPASSAALAEEIEETSSKPEEEVKKE